MVVGGVREECMGWAVCEGGGVVRCISRERKKEKKQHTFLLFCFWVSWVQFSTVVASVDLLGAVQVIRLAGEHV
jgi:hypothetical protein